MNITEALRTVNYFYGMSPRKSILIRGNMELVNHPLFTK